MLALWQIAVEDETRDACSTRLVGASASLRAAIDAASTMRCARSGAQARSAARSARYLARAGARRDLRRHGRRPRGRRSRVAVSASPARSTSFTVHVPAFTPDDAEGHVVRRSSSRQGASHRAGRARSSLPHLAPGGYVVSAQNGLNELVIAEVVGAGRTVGASSISAPTISSRASCTTAAAAPWWSARSTAASRRASPRSATRGAHFDPSAIVTANIWGYLWGKVAYGAMLFATALTNESIADALAMPQYRPVYIALAREMLAVATARGVQPEASTASTRPPSRHRAGRRGGALARRPGRAQPAVGEVPQRHLARPRRAQAPHRGRRAARHRRRARRATLACRRR